MLPFRARDRNRKSRLFGFLLIASFALIGCARQSPRDSHVLVVDFESSIADPNVPDGQAIAELVQAELINKPRIAVMTRQGLKPLMQKAIARQMSPVELGAKADADYLVIGSMTRSNGIYILNTQLYSVDAGQIVNNTSVTRTCRQERDIYPIVQAAARAEAHQLKLLAEIRDRVEGGEPIAPAAPAKETQP